MRVVKSWLAADMAHAASDLVHAAAALPTQAGADLLLASVGALPTESLPRDMPAAAMPPADMGCS